VDDLTQLAGQDTDPLTKGSYKFRCVYCSQRLRAFADLAGEEIECPRCMEMLRVMSRSEAAKIWDFSDEIERLFSVEELMRLRHEDKSVFVYTDGATTKNCWEFGLAGKLIRTRLAPFKDLLHDTSVAQKSGPPSVGDDRAHTQAIDARVEEFSVIVSSLHTLAVDRLPETLFADTLAEVMGLVHLVADAVIRLLAFHQSLTHLELPESGPYPKIAQTMATWSGHCWDELYATAEQLEVIHEGGLTIRSPLAQLSVTPPNFYEFMMLRGRLRA